MKIRFTFAALATLGVASGALAQVPPDIAEGIRKIGPVVDTPATNKLYAPLFAEQKEPYANVKVTRDIAYGADAANKLDVFTSGTGTGKAVVVYVHGGGFERGDKHPAGSPF